MNRTSEAEEAFKSTRLYSVIDCHNHTIRLKITLPIQAPNPPRGKLVSIRMVGDPIQAPNPPHGKRVSVRVVGNEGQISK